MSTEANSTGPTGPRTPEGKAKSSLNALKLGLSIQRHVVLPGEDPAAYAQLRDTIHQIYQPQSAREVLVTDDLAQCRWALRRFDEAELTALTKATEPWAHDDQPATPAQSLGFMAEPLDIFPSQGSGDGTTSLKPTARVPNSCWAGFQNLHRYRTWWERKHTRALAEFENACRARRNAIRDQQQADLHQIRLAAAERRKLLDLQRLAHAEASAQRRAHRPAPATGQAPQPTVEARNFFQHLFEEFVSQNKAAIVLAATAGHLHPPHGDPQPVQ